MDLSAHWKDSPGQIEKASKYCEGYKAFLNAGKTERECVKAAVKMLKKAGYRPYDRKASYEAGDKVYYVNRDKALIATTLAGSRFQRGSGSTGLILTRRGWI